MPLVNLTSMEQDILSTLTPQERDDLALCGITSDAQLARSTAEILCKDLQTARVYFPEREFCLNDARIQALFRISTTESAEEPGESVDTLPPIHKDPLPRAGFKTSGNKASEAKTKRIRNHSVVMHNPVRCSRPFTTLFSAIATLFLLVPLLSIIVFPYLLITDQLPWISVHFLAAIILIIPGLIYLLAGSRANCPVCHIRLFQFKHYNRHRAAHYLPLLGYNFATALHILFCWSYNCPGCGTPVKFLGKRRHRLHL